VITKRWLVRVFDELNQKFHYGWSGDCVVCLWVHDEIAVCCRPEIADQVGEIMVRHAKEPAEFYGFKGPLEADYKIGKSWAGNPAEPPAPPVTEPKSGPSKPMKEETPSEKPKRDEIPEPEEIADLPWIDVKAAFKSPQSTGNGRDLGYPHGEQRKGRRI